MNCERMRKWLRHLCECVLSLSSEWIIGFYASDADSNGSAKELKFVHANYNYLLLVEQKEISIIISFFFSLKLKKLINNIIHSQSPFFLHTRSQSREDVISKSKQLEEEAKRKATEDDDSDEPESTSEDSGVDDDVFYDSDVSEQEEE